MRSLLLGGLLYGGRMWLVFCGGDRLWREGAVSCGDITRDEGDGVGQPVASATIAENTRG